ncbi:aldehyde dehydrogenase family protein [Rhodococcus sp. IEGM 248]|nr:aldehyde dehydrogenase family protein [Rhodococcus sp. IEGM 248]
MSVTVDRPSSLDRTRFFIDGTWIDPVRTELRDQIEAATGERIGVAALGSEADIDAAVRAARRALDEGPWGRTTAAERATVLRAFADALDARAGDTATLVSRENGMILGLSQALNGGAPGALLRMYADIVENLPLESVRPSQAGSTIVRRVPVGVVGAIAPWNFPQALAMFKIAPALAAGCTVVLKPSPETALDSYVFADAAQEAGLPPGVLNIVLGDRDAGAALVSHPLVDKIAFTGSTEAGRIIGQECGRLLRRSTLELGGKSAAIVLEDANLETFLAGLDNASFLNNSQTCTTQSRILIARSRYDEVVDAVANFADSYTLGDPLDPSVTMGPMATPTHRDKVLGYIDIAKNSNARLVTGGGRPDGLDQGWFVQPTVFADVDNSDRLAREEVFGPVMALIPFEGDDEAVRMANDSNYGLGGSVWSVDEDRALGVARQVRTGTIGLNYYTLDLGAPFGGFKDSGLGRELGPEGLDPYLEYQSVYASTRYLESTTSAGAARNATASSPAEVVAAYFAGVAAGDAAAVADLFAPDALLHNAAGTLSGAEAIGRMYEGGLKAGKMIPSPRTPVVDGENVSVEIDLNANGSQIVLGDFFTVRDGKITRLAIYSLTPDGGRLLNDVGVDPSSRTP